MSQVSKRRKLSNGEYETSPPVSEHEIDDATTTPITAADTEIDKKIDQRRSLFVRSLPTSVTTEKLAEHFSQSFPLKHAVVILDSQTKTSKGFGFVTFTDAEDARAAVEQFNNSTIEGRKIKVEVAESRHREHAGNEGSLLDDVKVRKRGPTVNLKAEELRAQRQKDQEANKPPKLIVRNLPWSIKTAEDLSKLFMSYGKVKHAVVPTLGPKAQAGFGFVILRGKKNAEKALEGVNGKEVDGRTLAVDWAVDKDTWAKLQNENAADQSQEVEQGEKPDGQDKDHAIEDKSSEGTSADLSDEEGVELDDEVGLDDDLAVGADELADEALSASDDEKSAANSNDTTVFIRNLPFTTDDDTLRSHFHFTFGPVRYARVVYDQDTERSRGTGFVCFFNEDDAKKCVKDAPKHDASLAAPTNDKKRRGETLTHSLLQNDASDPSGKYTMDGRVLQITRALSKENADRRMDESSKKRDNDKRRLYLLSEGTVSKGSQLYEQLGKAEIDIREASARQRQRLVKSNANLGLSLTRLSIRNIPRSIGSKELKALAREAVVGFAKDVKDGKRQPLSKEELARGGVADKAAEHERKLKGSGIVKQIKIVFESEKSGSKVGEGKGGRSRGYGFIEYYGHRNALMGLRRLNGHLVKAASADGERNKRLIVEFAIENAQVLQRRAEREQKFREGGFRKRDDEEGNGRDLKPRFDRRRESGNKRDEGGRNGRDSRSGFKRKREYGNDGARDERRGGRDDKRQRSSNGPPKAKASAVPIADQDEKNKVAARNRIIAQKRQKRKVRKGGRG